MSRPTFAVSEPLVRVKIQGIKREYTKELFAAACKTEFGPLPLLPDDQGLVAEFTDWCWKGGGPQEYRMECVGGGQYVGYFLATDAERVVEWLEQRADRRDP